MALLKTLEICGIRNFSPDNQQVVYFNTPLVLFQGSNGSGKTTILESIRYSLTGEPPGGTNGGKGFVNEPRMSNRNLTKGSVKIKYVDAEGNIITVARVVQVQHTANGLKFTKLNNSIRKRDEHGNVNDISGRCADIDSYCCTSLNVSKSIFNNVLFCHQENSLWPLDEPQKLKEKFDEIFDAVRYNKCIDVIRKFIRDKQNSIKFHQERVDIRKTTKIRVDRQRAKLEERKQKLSEVKEGIEEKKNQLKPLEDRMEEILELEETLGSLQRKLTAKEEEKKGLINQQQAILKDIVHVFEGSDEELKDKIVSFKEEQLSEESTIKQLEKDVQEATRQLESVNLKIQNKQVKIGQMKEEKNQYNKKLEESSELIDKLRIELEVGDFSDKDILLEHLANALKTQQTKFSDLSSEKDAEENELQNEIDKLRENNAKSEQLITSKHSSIRDCQTKLKDIQEKLEDLDTSDSKLKTVTDKIESLQSTLTKLKSSFSEQEKLQEIQELKEVIERKEQYLEKLDRENRILQRNYAAEQKIESEKSLIIEKQGQINKIKNKHSQNLRKLFNDDVPERNLKKSILEIQNKQDVEFKAHTNAINKLERQLATLEASLNHLKSRLKASQQELSSNKRKVAEVCKGNDFKAALEESFNAKEKLYKNKGHFTAAKIMFEAFIGTFQEKSCCPICKTDFNDKKSAVPEIIRELKKKIEKVPTDLKQCEISLNQEESRYNKLQQLKTVNDDIETLTKNKIPELEKEISALNEEFEEKSMELAAEKNSLEMPQQLIEACKNVITDATLFDQYQTDIIKAKENVEDLEENIEKVPSNRTRQETEMEIDSVKGELSNTKNRYENNKDMLESHKDRCQDLTKKIQIEVQKQIDIQKLVQEKPLLEIQNTECNEKLLVLRTEIEELKIEVASQKQELKEAIAKKAKVTKINAQIKEQARNKIILYQNGLSDIHKLEGKINEYERNKNNEKLEKAIEELAELKVTLQNHEKNKNEIAESITKKREAIAKRGTEFRSLKDNVNLRKIQKQEESVSADVEKMKQRIGGFNYRQVFDEKKKKTEEISKKRREIHTLDGQLDEVQGQVDELEAELQQPEYKNAYKNYNLASYELTLNQVAIEELKLYAAVLERSVLRFHEERMVMINRTVRSLWRTIYRGNDIDYIEIKTDENMTGGAGKRRNYNYKVVQVKNGIDLDMRGRCSAGQKVLACLVIRMALAETFSSHCGILALDEPTTNLDKANIESLSDALSGLIDSRQNQSNFQLLIITHDEAFLRSLTNVQSIDSYWQVKRNEAGCSTVERQFL